MITKFLMIQTFHLSGKKMLNNQTTSTNGVLPLSKAIVALKELKSSKNGLFAVVFDHCSTLRALAGFCQLVLSLNG